MSGLVMIAEGDPFNLRLLEELCEEAGFDVVTAPDAESALQVIARHRPALIVLDMALRTADGTEVLEVLQSEPALAAVPVLLCTAQDDEDERRRGLELGAIDFLTRPYRVFEVERRIRNLLRLAAAEREAKSIRDSIEPTPSGEMDLVTHVGTEAQLRITLEYEATRAARYGHALSCLVVRIANLQQVLERGGEETAHGLIVQVAASLRAAIRSIDHAFRSDRDEFTLILPETTLAQAEVVIQRLRDAHAQRTLTGPAIEPRPVVQLGGSELASGRADGDALFRAARAALTELPSS
ncbi:MAG: response regulator [Sandaracinaceae bacterium]